MNGHVLDLPVSEKKALLIIMSARVHVNTLTQKCKGWKTHQGCNLVWPLRQIYI